MRTYSITKSQARLRLFALLGFGLGVLFSAWVLYDGKETVGVTIFLVVWIFGACFAIVEITKSPTKIQLNEEKHELIFFNEVFSRNRAVEDLRMIERPFLGNVTYFHFENSKQIMMARDWENLPDLIDWLRINGENVRVKGCF